MHKLFTILIFLLFLPSNVSAAVLFFDPVEKKVDLGSQFTVNLQLDSEGEFINAIEGTLEFPKNIKVVSVDYKDSVMSAWILEPKWNSKKLEFSGIIPGGFSGVYKPLEEKTFPGTLVSITFEGQKPGDGAISFDNVKALKNDGRGSEAEVSLIPFTFDVIGEENKFSSYKFAGIIIAVMILLFLYKLWRRS